MIGRGIAATRVCFDGSVHGFHLRVKNVETRIGPRWSAVGRRRAIANGGVAGTRHRVRLSDCIVEG
jgi:hypothetical protein